MDEVFIRINGKQHYFWRAVDQDGDVIDILVQPRRNQSAGERFFRRLLCGQGKKPFWIITDQQLADRFSAAELPPWEADAAFEQLLLSFESILPLRKPSDFRDRKFHQRVLSLTEGLLGRICTLLDTAAIEAIRSGEERITLSLVKEELVTEFLVSIADRVVRVKFCKLAVGHSW